MEFLYFSTDPRKKTGQMKNILPEQKETLDFLEKKQ